MYAGHQLAAGDHASLEPALHPVLDRPPRRGAQRTRAPQPERRNLLAQSFRVWAANACTDLEFLDVGYTDDGPGFNPRDPGANKNVIASVEDDGDVGLFPDPQLLAITLTSFSVETGEIFDADILINAARFRFEEVADEPACKSARRNVYDLRNTIVHEMGHFIGFDHETMGDSTMFASAPECETIKRDLTEDDRLGLCTVYPINQATHTCSPPSIAYDDADGNPDRFRDQCARATGSGGGCACLVASAREHGTSSLALVFVAALLFRKRLTGR
jgi:hypothetical protein